MVVPDDFFLDVFGYKQLQTKLVSFVLCSSIENTIFSDQAVCIISIFSQSSAGINGSFWWKLLIFKSGSSFCILLRSALV